MTKKDIRLKGHEKFTLREGWLNKGIIGVKEDSKLFSGIKGADKLGVGSNMVKSIRYWLQAFKLVDETKKDGTILSEFGKIVYENDIYFEDMFTLWLLHSNIAKNEQKATTWYLFFNKCDANEFTKDDLFEILKKEIIKLIGTEDFSENSLKDDIDVLLNMYSKENVNDDPEDKKNCPLSVLGLVKKEDNTYIKQQPEMRKINEWIVLYELSCLFENEESLSIDKVATLLENIYNMTKVTVNGFLDKLENAGYINVNRTAGLDVIYPLDMAKLMDIIEEYYKQHK